MPEENNKNVVMMTSTQLIKANTFDLGGWQCQHCKRFFAYSQPIDMELQLDMLKLFMDAHEDCKAK